jgi:hypothetical protein
MNVDRLHRHSRGEVILPGSPDYDRARRVWNGDIDRRPAVVARCADAHDVRAALGFARDEGLLVAVRGAVTTSPACRRATTGSSSTSVR